MAKQREAVEQIRVRAIAKRAGFGACTVAPTLRVRARRVWGQNLPTHAKEKGKSSMKISVTQTKMHFSKALNLLVIETKIDAACLSSSKLI